MGRTIYTPAHRSLATILRELRVESGLTQVELAKKLKRPQSYVAKNENGERRIDLVELAEITDALGVEFLDVVARWHGSLPKRKRRPTRRRSA